MSNLIILPIVLPMLIGTILIFFVKQNLIQRVLSSIGSIVLLLVSFYLMFVVNQQSQQILTLEAGNWAAPFGIVFVADMFSVLMVSFTSIVAIVCLFFAFQTISKEREKAYFYPFFFFLITGVNGAFLTGDLFNLFVFFEVMLIASYVLIVHGGTKFQLRESFKYMILNMIASTLFLAGAAYIYAVTGTLNMADLANRVATIGQTGVLNVVAIVFMVVFGAKGAFFPLYFWLPKSYYGPPAVVTALFGALLTKVGIYSVIRMFTLIFNHDIGFTHNLILIIAGLTMIFGVLGALSQFDFKRIINFQIISQVGFMIMGLGIYAPIALAGSIYYIVHDIIIKVALFFSVGVTEKVTGTTDLNKMGGLLRTHPWLGWMFFIAAMSLAGIPPLSGFFGKFGLVLSGLDTGHYLIVGVALLVSLLNLYSMMRIFMNGFWGKKKEVKYNLTNKETIGMLRPIIPLIALTILMGLGAEPIMDYTLDVANQLLDPTNYINAVLD